MNYLFFLEAAEDGDLLLEGVTALISGMLTVFAILILISFIISLFKHINGGEITHTREEVKVSAYVEKKEVPETDDLELVAVITAAIAASLNTTTDKLQVKSFRRINTNRR